MLSIGCSKTVDLFSTNLLLVGYLSTLQKVVFLLTVQFKAFLTQLLNFFSTLILDVFSLLNTLFYPLYTLPNNNNNYLNIYFIINKQLNY